jgi:hypothetical protein
MKPFWQSKTFWAVLIAGIIGLWNSLAPYTGLPPVPEWIITALAALGLYGRATAAGPLSWRGSDAGSDADSDRARLR